MPQAFILWIHYPGTNYPRLMSGVFSTLDAAKAWFSLPDVSGGRQNYPASFTWRDDAQNPNLTHFMNKTGLCYGTIETWPLFSKRDVIKIINARGENQ